MIQINGQIPQKFDTQMWKKCYGHCKGELFII